MIKMRLTAETRNIYLQMKVSPLTIISSLAPEICPNGLLTGDVLYTERVFLYRNLSYVCGGYWLKVIFP